MVKRHWMEWSSTIGKSLEQYHMEYLKFGRISRVISERFAVLCSMRVEHTAERANDDLTVLPVSKGFAISTELNAPSCSTVLLFEASHRSRRIMTVSVHCSATAVLEGQVQDDGV